MRFRSYKKNKLGEFFSRGVIIIFFAVVSAIFVVKYFSSKVDKVIVPMAEDKLRKVVTTIINDSTNDMKFDEDLINIKKNEKQEIQMVTYNTYEATKLINEITGNIQNNLEKFMEREESYLNGYMIQEIPYGAIFNSSFLRNVGPKIKFKTEMNGSIISNIETEVKPYGINNAYIETRVFLEVEGRIYLPFVSKIIRISNVIPLSMNIVQGVVPQAYITSFEQ